MAEHSRAACLPASRPSATLFIDDLPRKTMGKVQKNLLHERYKDAF